jgi:hypothetical protein
LQFFSAPAEVFRRIEFNLQETISPYSGGRKLVVVTEDFFCRHLFSVFRGLRSGNKRDKPGRFP